MYEHACFRMKAKFGSIVVDGRGKLGGHVYSKNRAGAYVRTKVTPVNPQTSSQVNARAILTQQSQDWRGLTEAQRTAWNNAVNDFQRTDIFGDLKAPTGLNLFTRLNANILHAGGAVLTAPPAASSAPDYVTFTAAASVGGGTFSIGFAPTPVPANTAYVVECTAQVSPGKNFLKNLYRIVQVFPAADATPTSIFAAYIAKFGALTLGQKIGVRITAVNLLTGLKSQATSVITIVAA